ncbi:hypothetical protein BDR26DRAFT_996475 [Obelidium mucronatum]|nr:hypothetical protein BDR26DRAFT_996475 [Obelidium mucronatum]
MPPRRWVAIYSRRGVVAVGPPPEELTEEFGKPVITLHRNNAIGVVSCTYRCYGRDGTFEDRTQVLFDPRTTELFMFRPVALWANSGQIWKLQAPLCALNTPHGEYFYFGEDLSTSYLESWLNEQDIDNLPKLSASERRKLAIKETLKGLQAAQEVIKAKVALKKAALAAKSRDADSAPHTFDVGDRAWLAIPLDGEAQRLGAPKKFIFRWVGPVRIISQSGGDSESSFTVVETFPGGEITTREVHVGRLRPFTPRKPIDSAEAAVINSHPSFEEELETWKNKALLLTRRPVHSHQPLYTTDPLLRKKLDPDYDPEDEVNPLYEIEKMVSVWREQNMFWYLVKFRNQPVRENRVFNDSTLPEETKRIFWEEQKEHNGEFYRKYRIWFKNRNKGDEPSPRDVDPQDPSLVDPVVVNVPLRSKVPRQPRREAKPLPPPTVMPPSRSSRRIAERNQRKAEEG